MPAQPRREEFTSLSGRRDTAHLGEHLDAPSLLVPEQIPDLAKQLIDAYVPGASRFFQSGFCGLPPSLATSRPPLFIQGGSYRVTGIEYVQGDGGHPDRVVVSFHYPYVDSSVTRDFPVSDPLQKGDGS